jgi:hypothetical protein
MPIQELLSPGTEKLKSKQVFMVGITVTSQNERKKS